MVSEDRTKRWRERLLQPPLFTVLGDQPLNASRGDWNDYFDLSGRVGPIYDILRHPDTPTPMAVAIYGDWGTGKTSAMRWLDAQLKAWREDGKAKKKITVRTAWFYPWKYQSKDDVWRGLVAEIIIACLEAKDPTSSAYLSAIKDFGAFLGKSFVSIVSGAKLSLGLAEIGKLDIAGKPLQEIAVHVHDLVSPQNAYLNDFEVTFEAWIKKTLGENERMVVFIDDLDRCLPEIVLQVLEALKLYLNIENLIFLVGVDRDVVDTVVSKHYDSLGLGSEKSANYLAKMFTVEVPLAPSESQMDDFLDSLLEENETWWTLDDLEREVFRGVIRDLAVRSPREVKRLINSSLMAGAGAQMSSMVDKQAKEISATAGMLVFFVQHILHRHKDSALVAQNRGTRFFTAWSNVVRGAQDTARTITVPQSYVKALKESRDLPESRQSAESELDKAFASLSDTCRAYEDVLKNPSFADAIYLLSDAQLGELMRLPYPAQAAAISSALGGGGAAAIVREAIARHLAKAPEALTENDYKDITELDLSSQEIEDLEAVAALTSLERLYLAGAQVNDLTPLAPLTCLKELVLSGTNVRDLAPLAILARLQALNLRGTQVGDLTPLQALTSLLKLDLRLAQVSDLGPLADLTRLQLLDLRDNTHVHDLSPLQTLIDLEELYLRHTQVSDVEPLQGLTHLRVLDISGTRVGNLVPLRALTCLEALDLRKTQVSDLAPLAALTRLQELDLNGTQVSDLAPLAALSCLEQLYLAGTQISDLAPLRALTQLRLLELAGTHVSEEKRATLKAALPHLSII